MATYPQSQAYGHMSYPAQAYPPQSYPPPNYYQPPPPPQHVYYADPNHFRRDYFARLAELTVNSRPIIQGLSMTAQEYARYADIVVNCIEQHIRRVPPWMKLPAFYLLDAISKNVFDPYARHFIPIVVRLFLDTYEQVDQSTRSKMEEMLLTWRTGAPTGRELFGPIPQVAIERQIWGGESTQPAISTAQVLSELEFVLGTKQRILQTNPYDKQTQNHVNVLFQLKKLVQAGVSQAELSQILTQLRTLAPAPAAPPVPPVVPVHHDSQALYQSSVSVPPPSVPQSAAYPSSYPQPSYGNPSYPAVKLEAAPQPVLPASSAAVGPSSAPAIPVNISSLFSSLVKSGVLSSSSTPQGAGNITDNKESAPAVDASQDYRSYILSLGIRLTSVDIVKQRSPITKLLYDNLSNQCKQCGIRFSGDAAGKKKLEGHLDMHFNQNRKASQAAARGYSRNWLVGIEDWLHDGAVGSNGKGRIDGSRPKALAAEVAQRDAELRATFVVVPPGDEAKLISCPICKETLKSEFMEDDEEWVWRNAVKRDDRIYHATCHAEAMSSKSNLAVRLRSEISGSRSRSRTPEVSRTPPRALGLHHEDAKTRLSRSPPGSPAKTVGTKRKAEDDEATQKSEGREATPPTKKVALSS
ncbi:hypothetical protein PHLGIDRAFT_61295 [Phlebiopsis gigantea 11061_1 CR5-6]|uniref:CID domain-containing protein n=1 Tax=Phlebiopsis gigantea (strain 11061_1 CR5-6) TaxID=745531 RepID=A0A0C3P4I8_PHLG1|nr:hypothetical protein PHLGIDRAFT_61295 [Phlebiopsis gigantea 11061_1 CR5-6]